MAHLKVLLKSHGVTQTQLARVLGRDKSAITNLLQGKRQLKAEEVIKISDFLKVSEAEVLGTRAPGSKAAAGMEEPVFIPFFSAPQARDGRPVIERGGAFYLEDGGLGGDKQFALEVKDESMNLSGFLPGDIVICDPDAELRDGRVVVAQQYVNDAAETLIRQYRPPYLLPNSTHQGFPQLHDERANVRVVAPVIKLIRFL